MFIVLAVSSAPEARWNVAGDEITGNVFASIRVLEGRRTGVRLRAVPASLQDANLSSADSGGYALLHHRLHSVAPLAQRIIAHARATNTSHLNHHYSFNRRWNDLGRVNASNPSRDSVQPRPESLTPVQASAGSK